MSETKHTPGPWTCEQSASGHDIVARQFQYGDGQFLNDAHLYHLPTKTDIQWRLGKDSFLYASLSYETWRQFPQKDWDEQQVANGQLMAAAPEMLEACKIALISLRAWNTMGMKLDAPENLVVRDAYEHSPEIKALVTAIQKAEGGK